LECEKSRLIAEPVPGGFEEMDNIMDYNRDKTKGRVITSDVTGLVGWLVGWLVGSRNWLELFLACNWLVTENLAQLVNFRP
jgi:hypothetical protein